MGRQLSVQAMACGAILMAAVLGSGSGASAATEAAYTVSNYPVDASAANAVAAKDKAHADGRQAAFRSLLKRLVPVTSYSLISRVKGEDAGRLIEGVAVRSEQTSSTQYIASLDFSFQPQAVRDLLARQGIPFVDVQAPKVVLVPVYTAPAGGQAASGDLSQARAGRAWATVWKGLDLEHSLTPVKLETLKPDVSPQVLQAIRNGEGSALTSVARAYAADYLLVAFAEGDAAGKRLNVTLSGQDAVGGFVLKRSYRLAADDFAYTAELAAVVALGTLEGRWKAQKLPSAGGSARGGFGGPSRPVQLMVEFRSLQQWQDIRRQIAEIPGVQNVEVGGISARNADVELSYPGGGESLADALAAQGLQVNRVGDALVVRPNP